MPDVLRLLGSSGANRAMEAELKRLASRSLGGRLPRPARPSPQTLVYPFDPELAWLAVRYSRCASRVLWDLVRAEAARLEPLYAAVVGHLSSAPAWAAPGARFAVDVVRSDGFPAGPLQIRGAVKNALIDASAAWGRLELDPDDPDLLFRVEADEAGATVSLDLAGRSLHRRGFRRRVSEASLKETLAAQVLLLSRWDPRTEAIVDPMAGTGTFVLEAAGSAVGASVWRAPDRPIAARFPPFCGRPTDTPDLFPGTEPALAAIEVHTPVHRALRENLAEAGLDERVLALHADFRDVPPNELPARLGADRGLVVVNPPYGERLEQGRGHDPELDGLYADLHQWWMDLGEGWRIALLGPRRPLMAHFGDRPRLDKPMKNGALSVSLLVYER